MKNAFLMLLAVVSLASGQPVPSQQNAGTPQEPVTKSKAEPDDATKKTVEDSKKKFEDFHALYDTCSAGVVEIVISNGKRPIARGSGFFVSAQGMLVTNRHVVFDADLQKIELKLKNGATTTASVLAVNEDADVAVLLPDTNTSVPYCFAGRSLDSLQIGEPAIAIGNPSGLFLSISKGLVAGFRTSDEVVDALRITVPGTIIPKHGYKYVQTDANIWHGSSGGPLLDKDGRVLGINTSGSSEQRVGFAIEWKAAEDLIAKADASKPIPLEDIRTRVKEAAKRAGAVVPLTYTGTKVPAAIVKADMDHVIVYCPKCAGTRRVKETRQAPAQQLPGTILTRGGTRNSGGIIVETVTCRSCNGTGLYLQLDKMYDAICTLTTHLIQADESDPLFKGLPERAQDLYAECAIDSIGYAQAFNDRNRAVLGSPQKNIAKPVVLYGQVLQSSQSPSSTMLVVWIYGSKQVALVACRECVSALDGQYCVVFGIVNGISTDGTIPLVQAVAVKGLHANTRR